MLLKKTNIEEKLQRFRNKTISQDDILRDVEQILKQDNKKEETIINTLKTGNNSVENNFIFDLLESDKIYHIDTIKGICIDYRLRFLDTKYFKNDIPYSAITKIKKLEKAHDININGYKIIAPSKLFKLENADDPLLFAPIGNGYYYLIHKWGNDLSPMRKWLMMPFRNFENLVFTTVMVSFLATFLIPDGLFSKQNTSAEFWLTFFFMFKTVGAIVIYYAFASGKNFNTAIWDSKYYNA
ncbi:hypothetical protein [Paucihalobacter sp.]|uniref:hypothetical protein n=1 Tax=Paucihalobacter sp. TaxID=2850405 RepID=UPI003D16143C